MSTYYHPLEEPESLKGPFAGALFLHVGLFVFAVSYSWMLTRSTLSFGDPHAVPGGAVPINVVKNIALAPPQTAVINPVANDTRSAVPTPPPEKTKKAQEKVEVPENAVPIPSSKAQKKAERQAAQKKFRPYVPDRDNQLYSMKGMGVNTPSYSGLQPDAFGAGIGIGPGTPFGSKYGWYVEALQRRIGEQWQRELMQVDQRVRMAPRAVIWFDIQRDGSLRNIKLGQTSGNSAVDYSALRAVTNANPVAPLPPDLGRNSVSVEIWFQLKR